MNPGTELSATRRGRRLDAANSHSTSTVTMGPARRPTPKTRWSRRRAVQGTFAAIVAAGFAATYIVPLGTGISTANAEEVSAPVSLYASSLSDVQNFEASSDSTSAALERGTYEVFVKPKPTPVPVAATTAKSSGGSSASSGWSAPFVAPDPGSAQSIAYGMVTARGWGSGEFACLVSLWKKESGWRVNAYNASSGAYGIPQSLPGSKMASVGADWATNPATQITWGLNYIGGRYGSPCGAWGHSQRVGWY